MTPEFPSKTKEDIRPEQILEQLKRIADALTKDLPE